MRSDYEKLCSSLFAMDILYRNGMLCREQKGKYISELIQADLDPVVKKVLYSRLYELGLQQFGMRPCS